ncbi:MAG: hypothetical protein BWY73_01647 [candidate division TA06 bacterium ADurb.Bin417]|uniref:Uncharacterized protein n=1 Tax=candidate division TA06 bacterium ADurb.Bin417 TaxID=1852828 RepID=A0A1V5M5Q1_UNCT6|nr:MAG: hypothetical protein BWY73_01647 [candidate division TA06 bacterium ADurb.Bin417]
MIWPGRVPMAAITPNSVKRSWMAISMVFMMASATMIEMMIIRTVCMAMSSSTSWTMSGATSFQLSTSRPAPASRRSSSRSAAGTSFERRVRKTSSEMRSP